MIESQSDKTIMQTHCKHDELVLCSSLRPHPKNRNDHPKEQIERLAKILSYQGLRAPIVVSKRSGFIVKGHGTLEAIKKNGWTEAPVVFQDFHSDEQEYAFVQSDNAIALWADLDFKGLNEDLGDLGPDFDLELLGIENFKLDPEHEPGTGMMVTCPHCNEQFAAKGRVKKGNATLSETA